MSPKNRRRGASISTFQHDQLHHLAGLEPQTPLGSNTPERTVSPVPGLRSVSSWLRWVVYPSESIKLLLIPLVLYVNWELLAPFFAGSLRHLFPSIPDYPDQIPNPFGYIFLISHRVPDSSPDDPRYAKGWSDLVFLGYYLIFWSFVRQVVAVNISRRIARYFGIKKQRKLERFGEQGYACFYFAIMGAWGYRIMTQLPTYWYRTEYFWIDYPHWDMKPELKRYYLMQMAYWAQQLFVLVLGLEKPRKDYYELIAHHTVTIWLVGWSYLVNMTLIGNAVYLSMDIPDTFLAFSKILNYIQWERAKVVSFAVFIGIWTYFRHILNIYILISVWTEFDLIPETSKKWVWADGTYMVSWMRYQIFTPLLLLQLLNLFWYWLIMKILARAVFTSEVDDERSDDEDDEDHQKD